MMPIPQSINSGELGSGTGKNEIPRPAKVVSKTAVIGSVLELEKDKLTSNDLDFRSMMPTSKETTPATKSKCAPSSPWI